MTATLEQRDRTAASPQEDTRPIKFYQLVMGRHMGDDPVTNTKRIWAFNQPGHNVVPSRDNLCKRFPNKFRLLTEGTTANVDPETLMRPGETLNEFANRMTELARVRGGGSAQSLTSNDPAPGTSLETFDGMTIAELKAYAESEEIDLGPATKKEDILRIVKASVTGG